MRALLVAAALACAAVVPAHADPIPSCITAPCEYECVRYPCYPTDWIDWTVDQLPVH